MSWKTTFSLGIPGYEQPISGQILGITFEERTIEAEARNIAGASRRSIMRIEVPSITLQAAALTDAIVARLRGLRASQTVLNFICNTGLKVSDLFLTANTTLLVVLPPTSMSGITITGVYLSTDVNRSGTNYFTSGSFDPVTGEITLGSALPSADELVVVDLSFTGHSVLMTKLAPVPHQGQYQDLWQATIELMGA